MYFCQFIVRISTSAQRYYFAFRLFVYNPGHVTYRASADVGGGRGGGLAYLLCTFEYVIQLGGL